MSDFDSSKCYALTIGVGKRETDGEYMSVTAEDARRVGQELERNGGYRQVKVLDSEQAIKTNVISELDELIQVTKIETIDLVIIYFSGHGQKEEESPDYFLICHDTKNNDLKRTALKGSDFVKKLIQIQSEKLLIILDCCHAEGVLNTDVPFPTADLLEKNNRVIISSSRSHEKSKAGDPVSVFTFALLNGLAGQFLQNDRKDISLFDLAMYTREVVVFRTGHKQHPQLNILKKKGATTNFTIIHSPTGKRNVLPITGWKKSAFDKGDTVVDTSEIDLEYIPRDEEYRARFKPLIAGIKEEIYPIVHFKTVNELIKYSREEILFKENLTFYTKIEKEQHQDLINYLKVNRVGILLGHPATGKSIAVVEIAKQLKQDGFSTYYYSFKTKERWPNILEEMARYAGPNIVFIIDDIHLDISKAVEAYNKLGNFPKLRILFISRVVTHMDLNEIDIYEELEEYTVKTEEPSIDEKVGGIIKKHQGYLQKTHPQNKYRIGNLKDIIDRTHRNLIVLREYLKIWEDHPVETLSNLKEGQLYQVMYNHYFDTEGVAGDWEECLLQYLALYYFEISFYANPQYLSQTESLAKNANRLVREPGKVFSIYHGEYAHLLLKAYRSIKDNNFRYKYETWDNFFFQQIKNYLLSFQRKSNIPENLIEILVKVVRFRKEVPGIVKDIDNLFKNLILDKEVRSFILEGCRFSNEGDFILRFMSAVAFQLPQFFKSFFEAFSFEDRIFNLENSLSIYSFGLYYLNSDRSLMSELKWLKNYDLDKLGLMVENSKLSVIGVSLRTTSKINFSKTQKLYQQLKDGDLVEKAGAVSFNRIGRALSDLRNVDVKKTQKLYQQLKDGDLVEKASAVSFNSIGRALSDLRNVDAKKTQKLYQQLKDGDLVEKASAISFDRIGHALSELGNIDAEKTQKLYQQLNERDLIEKAGAVSFGRIGHALSELRSIDAKKTQKLYQQLKDGDLIEKAGAVSFNRIGNALSELRSIDAKKTQKLYQQLKDGDLAEKAGAVSFNKIGNALSDLKNIDAKKTQKLYQQLKDGDLVEKASAISFDRIGHALSELGSIDLEKTQKLYQQLNGRDLIEKAGAVSFNKIGKALNELGSIDLEKTQKLYQQLNERDLIEKADAVSFNKIGKALNELGSIDLEKTQKLYQQLNGRDLIEKAGAVSFNKIGKALSDLRSIDLEKTQKLYQQLNGRDLIEKAGAVSFNKIGKALNELGSIDLEKTQKLYQQLNERDLIEKAGAVSFDRIGHALNELGNIDVEKTSQIYAKIGNEILLDKLKYGKRSYLWLLTPLSAFSKVNPILGKGLLEGIPEKDLFKWEELKRIETFNLLAYTFRSSEVDQDDIRFKELLDFGMINKENYFRTQKLSELSRYIDLMHYYFDWEETMQNNLGRFHGKILHSKEKEKIAELISTVHKINPEGAINYLLKSYQRNNPNELEVIGFSHFFIGKNLIEEKEKEPAKFHLNKAKRLLSQFDDHQYTLDEINELLDS